MPVLPDCRAPYISLNVIPASSVASSVATSACHLRPDLRRSGSLTMSLFEESRIIIASCIFVHWYSSRIHPSKSVHARQHLLVFLGLPTIFSVSSFSFCLILSTRDNAISYIVSDRSSLGRRQNWQQHNLKRPPPAASIPSSACH